MTKARTLADNYAADINQVSAGVGITGGGTSGTVTITNDMATSINAKGDLVVGTANDTYSRLAVASTAGYVLTVDSAEATGLKWAAASTGALVYITGATLTNASSWNFSDNTFTSTYRNYVIIMEGRDNSNNDAIYWFFRAGGSNNGSGNVKFAVDGLTFDNGTFTQTGTANSYFLAGYPNASGGAYTLTVYAPQVATYTQVTGVASATSNATSQGGHTSFSAFVNATTQYDAMGFTMSGNSFTGTYRVYGIKDS